MTASDTYTSSFCDIKGKVEPFAALNVIGDEGVETTITYATVSVNAYLMTVKLPIESNIGNPEKADSSSPLSVSGLSGSTHFISGFCIPIPFLDDICKNLTTGMLKWNGTDTNKFAKDNSGVHE